MVIKGNELHLPTILKRDIGISSLKIVTNVFSCTKGFYSLVFISWLEVAGWIILQYIRQSVVNLEWKHQVVRASHFKFTAF